MIKEPKILVYDIETTPVLAWVWRCGEQYVGHNQLHEDFNLTKIICITYRWNYENKAKALVFDLETLDDTEIIKDFDDILKQADVIIGKNNNKFDDKHINMRRFMNGLPPLPDWSRHSDDLEKQMRKHFNMQSYSLDYFAKVTGGEGKIKMCLDDWIQIVLHKNKSRLAKMVKYGKKDADDTMELIEKVRPYVTFKYNFAAHHGDLRCTSCGSEDIIKNGTRLVGSLRKQRWACNNCGGHAGYTSLTAKNTKITK